MWHLIVIACTAQGLCADRWLPAADSADAAGCMAAGVADDWLSRHALTEGGPRRCVTTAALPALPLAELAPGVWVHQGAVAEAGPANGGGIANLGVVDGGDAVAVVDAGGSRAEAEQLLAAIRARTDAPVTHLILTHVHPDHSLGAEVFAEAGAEIVANARLGDALAARAGAYGTTYRAQIGEAAWHGSAFVRPDRGIAAPETLRIGDATLTLTPVATAHTDSDLTVRVAPSGVLFTGDLLFRGLTPTLDGSLLGWLDWIGIAPDPARVVPGHGAPAPDWPEASAETRVFLETLAAATRAALAEGLSLGEAVPAVAAAMAPLAPGRVLFEDTVRRDAAAAYAELEWE